MSDKNQRQEQFIPETPEALVSLAQRYFSDDFPNHAGRDCPSRDEIEGIILPGNLPGDSLCEHLFSCSRCFVIYRELLQKHRQGQPARIPFWRRVSWILPERRPLIAAASVLVVCGLVAAGLYLVPGEDQESAISTTRSIEVVNATPSPSISPSPFRVLVPQESFEEVTIVARVDLQSYSLRRGADAGQEPAPPQAIRQGTTRFAITMPQGSPAGAYAVSILDEFGKALRTKTAYSADGAKLTTTLNLNNLKREKYRLCVSRVDELPNCYPILITK